MTIYFTNPGTFDIRALSMFGVHAKPNSTNPIGQFGTGLKFAVAGVLRLGGTVTIRSGGANWTIFSKLEDFRGQPTKMCWLVEGRSRATALPFSTELGKHWKPWMIYREFWCNAKDEGAAARPSKAAPGGGSPGVVFEVCCPEVEAVLSAHDDYFVEGSPMDRLGGVELHPGPSKTVFFKGVAVLESSKPWAFRYNFSSGLNLTEDRTVSDWEVKYELARAVAKAAPGQEPLVRSIIGSEEDSNEAGLYWPAVIVPGEVFKAELVSAMRTKRSTLPEGVKKWGTMNLMESLEIETIPGSVSQLGALKQLEPLWEATFGSGLPPVRFLPSTRPELGLALRGEIYLGQGAFASLPELFTTLVEEWLHVSKRVRDNSREMQEALLTVIKQLAFGRGEGREMVMLGLQPAYIDLDDQLGAPSTEEDMKAMAEYDGFEKEELPL